MMNNFGMNPMLMNPMIMNNFGMMGMNNQQNLMDENAIRIKNIIQPYENKIKELEEIIRQKDFEIALLKDKLNNNGINIQSQNFININPINQMNMMMPISNVENSKRGKEIIVYLMNNVNNITKQYSCFENDMTYILFDKMYQNYPWNLLGHYIEGKKIKLLIKTDGEIFEIFCFERDKISKIREKCNIYGKDLVYNYRILFENSTFSEYGIMSYSIIQAESVKGQNVIFKDASGRIINLALNKKCPLNIALMHYLIISGDPFQLVSLLNNTKRINFSYNANLLNFKDETPIENIFKNFNSYVMVTFY